MRHINGPKFGYEVRSDLPREVVRAMLSNMRQRGRVEMFTLNGPGVGYFFNASDEKIVVAFLNDPEEVRLAYTTAKSLAGVGAGIAKKRAAAAAVILDVQLGDMRMVVKKEDQIDLESFVLEIYNENEALRQRCESVELALADATTESDAMSDQLIAMTERSRVNRAQIMQLSSQRDFAASRVDEMHKQFVAIGKKPRFRISAVSQRLIQMIRAA